MIQVPKIQVNPTEQPNQAPRLQEPQLNVEAPMDRTMGALDTAGKEVVRYRDQMMYHEADNTGTERDNTFQDWYNKEMNGDPATGKVGLKYQQGDPKVLYEEFHKRAQDKLNDLSSSPEGQTWSDLTQNVVNRRLNKRAEELHNETLTQYGHQKFLYDRDTKDTAVDFAQKKMPSFSAQVDPDHPETFGRMQSAIEDIKQPIISHALQYGGAVQSADGGVVLTPSTKQEIAKAVSDGLYKTIDNLYNSDQGDGVAIKKAEAIKEQFADQLDPFHKDTLSHKADEAIIKQKALALAPKLLHAEDPEAVARSSGLSLEIQDKALSIASEQRAHISGLKKEQANANYKTLFGHVDQVMRSEQPYSGLNALSSDPVYAETWKYLTPAQQRTVEGMVVKPKNDNPGALDKMVNLFVGADPKNKVLGMDQATFEQYKAGLSGPTAKHYQDMFVRQNSQTNAQANNQVQQFYKEFDQQAVGARLLTKMPNSQFFTPSDQIRAAQMKKELLDAVADLGPTTTKERSDFVAKFVADKLADKVFQPPPIRQFNGGGNKSQPPAASPGATTAPVNPNTDTSKFVGNLNPAQRLQYSLKYRAMNSGAIPTEKQLNDFIVKQVNNKASGN